MEFLTKPTCRWTRWGPRALNSQKQKITPKCSTKGHSKIDFLLINLSQTPPGNLKMLISLIMIHNYVSVRIVFVEDISVKCIKLSQTYQKIASTRKITSEKILLRIKSISQANMINYKALTYRWIQSIWRIIPIEKETISKDRLLKIYWRQVDLHLTWQATLQVSQAINATINM